jgi:hypothetical protein
MTRMMVVVGRMMRDHPSDKAGTLDWFTDHLTCRSNSLSLLDYVFSVLYHHVAVFFRIECFIWISTVIWGLQELSKSVVLDLCKP